MNSKAPKESGGPQERELTPLELLRKGYEEGQSMEDNSQDIKTLLYP